MNVESQFLFFFSALGAFNGLVLSLYFIFFSKPKSLSNVFLGLLLFTLSIRVGKSVFFYFNPYLSKTYLQIGLSACFLIGPFLYFYLLYAQRKDTRLRQKDLIHIGALLFILLFVGLNYPYSSYPQLWRKPFIKTIYYSWLAYIFLAGYISRKSIGDFFTKSKKLSAQQIWQLNIFMGNVIIWIAYNTTTYTSYIAGALSFSFMFYVLGMLVLSQRKKPMSHQQKEKYNNRALRHSI